MMSFKPKTLRRQIMLGVLVPAPGATPDPDAIMDAVRDVLARFKHPRKLVILDELPRNTMGKVQKKALREDYAGVFGDG